MEKAENTNDCGKIQISVYPDKTQKNNEKSLSL
jgi:hypothetical protein